MTNLERFLNKVKSFSGVSPALEPASGSFMCQNTECEEIVYEGYFDRPNNRLKWICSHGHDSSVIV